MTENEAIEILKNNFPKTCKMVDGRYKGGFDDTECEFGQALLLSISALEEIQQYRVIGTVEECREARRKQQAKKPNIGNDNGRKRKCCSVCGCFYAPTSRYCPKCGQAIKQYE
ncbi:MAG: hypothetical protein HFH72_09315 [Lachnospiraceae bacterium]|nr:hypothetical protein [Lachnospiraceae bacterium]